MRLALDSQDLPPAEIRRRFGWARRQGNPAWLWPEIAPQAWREARAAVEAAVRGALSGIAGAPLDGDPAAIGLVCYISGVGPLLGWWCEQGLASASAAIEPILELHLRHNRMRSKRMEAAAVALVDALADRGIEVVVLKGAHTGSAYFPEPGARPASDIDLLVAADKADAAEDVLRAEEFMIESRGARESSWRLALGSAEPRALTLVHADDPWSVDLHTSLSLFVSAGAPLAGLDVGQPMSSQRRWARRPWARVLDPPLLVLHLAAHAGSGLQSLTLLRLVELVLVIRQEVAAGALSWDDVLAMGERTGSLGYAYPALRLCDDLSPGLVPEAVLNRCAGKAPPAVLRIIAGLTPASAQRVDRSSVAEHFMWSRGWSGYLRQFAADIAPSAVSWRRLWSIYEARAWGLIRGRFSR